MKVKILSRNPDEYQRETKLDIPKLHRNYSAEVHPFQQEREYVRALNATKLERVFAKPFMGALEGHTDGVNCLLSRSDNLSTILSGSYDGQVKVWNIAQRECMKTVQAHQGYVRGMCVNPAHDRLYTVGDDKALKHWKLGGKMKRPLDVIQTQFPLHGVSHHHAKEQYATCGSVVAVYDTTRHTPLKEYRWGVDSIHKLHYNPIEVDLLGAVASDRSILLYDTREQTPMKKVIMKLRSNAIAWNPMEAFCFTVANEDYNLYSFDLRYLDHPTTIHVDHTAAVLDVAYSPTGREFVSGSYDRTIRLWRCGQVKSRDVYHTKRMQRVQCVAFSGDSRFILSGSDEMNIRVWKTNASAKLGPMRPRERDALNYAETLRHKYASHPEIRRIARHRHVPKHVYNAANELRTIRQSRLRKHANRQAHSKPGSVPDIVERDQNMIGEVD